MVGAVAVLVCLFGAVFAWPAFLRSWLTATLLWGAVPLGALGVLMTHGLTGGAWGDRTHGVWIALVATMPLFALALLLLLPGLGVLFPWTQPAEQLPEIVQRKTLYLNIPFFVVRSLLYVVIWVGLVWLLGAWRGRARAVNAPGLILWVFSLTFFGFDWVLSLEPRFYTDVFGLMLVTGSAGAAMALGLLLAAPLVEPPLRRDLANLWLAVLLAWAFMTFAQYIIVWSANMPHEIEWYLPRLRGGWGGVAVALIAVHFLLPFAALLFRATKRRRSSLLAVAMLVLVAHVTEVAWRVLPSFEEPGVWTAVSAAASTIGIGGCMIAGFGRALGWTGMPETEEEPA